MEPVIAKKVAEEFHPQAHRRVPKALNRMLERNINRAESNIEIYERRLKEAQKDLSEAKEQLRELREEQSILSAVATKYALQLPENSKAVKAAVSQHEREEARRLEREAKEELDNFVYAA